MKRFLTLLALIVSTGSLAFAQQKITGRVTDSQGDPIPWANVFQKGTQNGTTTDDDGNYSISVKSADAILVASFVGYQDAEQAVSGRSVINFTLESDTELLDDAVVIGYGTARRQDLTGSVASINSDNLKNQVLFSVDDALKGGVAGLMVSSTSGQPGAASKMLIRGAASLSGSTSPLIVVDGFPLNDVSTSSGMGMSGLDSQMSSLSMINTEDIASIEVLKDASSTAIYGNRGANGVIMITTKKGKASSGRIQYNGYFSVQNLPHKYEMLDFKGYASMMNEKNPSYLLFSDANGNLRDFDYDRIESIDWQDRIYRTGLIQSHNLSLQQSTDKTNFLVSASYMQNESIVICTDWQKLTGKVNIDHNFTDKFKIGIDLNYSRIVDDGVPTSGGDGTAVGTITSALLSQPFDLTDEQTQVLFRRAGVEQYQINAFNEANKQNPVTMANDIQMKKILNRTIANSYLQYNILDDLVLKVTGGFDNYGMEDKQFYPTTTPRGYLYNAQACMANVSTFGWINENTLTWSPVFAEKHRLNVMGGVTEQGSRYYYTATEASSFSNESLGYNNLSLAKDFHSYSNTSSSSMLSFIFRTNYIYDNRYIGTFTFRRDGTSAFVKNKWGSFFSGALAWNAKQEEFLKFNNDISTLKLRASLGEVGNSNVPTSGSFAQLYTTSTAFGTSLSIGQSPVTLANENLTWEKTLEYNLGLELGFFDERLHFDLDLYNKTTRDLLLEAPVLNISGYTKAWQNIGSIRNMGVELSMNATLIDTRDFQWTFNGNISRNKSKILKLGQSGAPIYLGITCLGGQNAVILREGGSVGELYGYRAIGIYQLDEFTATESTTKPGTYIYTLKDGVVNQGVGEQPGSIRLWDKDGNGKIDDNDREVIGNFLPDFYGAFSTSLNYKAFNLYLGFQYSYGNDLYNANYAMIAFYNGDGSNQSAAWNKRWTVDNQSSRYYSQISKGLVSSAFVEDASYLRFSSARFTYTLPAKLLTKFQHIENCKVYLSADNIYTFTKYSGYDPEVGISQNSASAILSQGFDYGNFPHARTFTVGVNLSFR
jgi:TonB-dependent starch-binding outer membrane protein SusC